MKPSEIVFQRQKNAERTPKFFAILSTTALCAFFGTFFASFFGTGESAFAIDLNFNLPISRLFGDGSFDESQTDAETNAVPAPPVESFQAPSTPNRSPSTQWEQSSSQPPADALKPLFSQRLPYCVVLGKVVCEANFPIDSVAGLEEEITRLQLDLVGYLGVPEARETIELCLFRDKGSYIDFIGANFPTAPLDRPALYVKASGPGVLMIPRDDEMIVNIRHEMTHAYLNASLRNVPIWLDEGLAKYFETPPGERGFRNPFLKVAERDANGLFGSAPSLDRLEKLTRVDQMRSREYRESWSWTHFLLHYSNDTHRVLGLYLKSLRPEEQEGVSMKEAFKRQKKAPMKRLLTKYVPDYEKKYVEHFRSWDARRSAYESARAEAARLAAQTNAELPNR